MKLFLFSAVLLLFCLSTQAQSPQTHKIVYLKNGTNIKGTVTVNDSAGYVMIVDNYKETYYYQKNMVAKIVDDDITRKRSYNLKSKGYICTVEIGGTEIINPDAGSIAAFSFDVINSYLISPIASIGLGVGGELGSNSTETFSLYANSRTYFIKSDISPFFNIGFGYTTIFSNNSNYYGYGYSENRLANGLIFNPAFGVRVAISKKHHSHAAWDLKYTIRKMMMIWVPSPLEQDFNFKLWII